MNVYIRVDASIEIGTGHVMRCLTLAEKLQEQGADVRFICREHKGHLIDLITAKGYEVLVLKRPQENGMAPNGRGHTQWLGVPLSVDAHQTKELLMNCPCDLLIVDHYAINEDWEVLLRDQVKKIMVIDDLADRKHDCDFLLDQNFIQDYQNRYDSLLPSYCKTFLGPSYVLLRPEFYHQLKKQKLRTGAVKRILIFYGGIDHTNETGKALSSFLALGRNDIEVDVVVGQSNLYKMEIASICNMYEYLHFHCQIDNMAELMNWADLSIGAGGTTTWERCLLGLPSIVVSIAENQEEICKSLAKGKVITYLGEKETIEQSCLTRHLKILIENEAERTEMSRLSYQLMKDTMVSQQMMIKELMG
ncbi:UDP-2,4-diacetamido-2,4,6-trideoxy-beta-L-altropyranose hydrolase [Neobacillus drentensis]|uniref:UDP-2,4-diacetamido-2,4, 6-trideoxy-beta-L-altropyranose hydrolase n=1 Tax=Neobacillus drentensis TaxID=220684 RepID=UPI001F3EF878|nr:UDP-2,4-diacetamido-2,4,6-trideoxy-beta-L-altropyranose hydrolase [Neobacillus drentensis]ULT56477.1 UDP-2,4-diacetamido-2,4,6-trideoxy-beta-L-altropyranose hydrolase [Neobacillus drentensis]